MLWLGYVLAVSFTEAWVKFKSPFLPRHFGLDVGRTVFPVLNAVEVAFCAALWSVRLVFGMPTPRASPFLPAALRSPLSAATLVLAAQVLYLTPKLVLIGKIVIREALTADGGPKDDDAYWTEDRRRQFADLSDEVAKANRPPACLHFVYVLAEAVKVAALGGFVWGFRCR